MTKIWLVTTTDKTFLGFSTDYCHFLWSFIFFAYRTMPSSFDGKYGSTRYWLRAEINRLRIKSDKTKKTITFINPLNVSLPEYQVTYMH